MWWLCIDLPHLPLEIFARSDVVSFPFAVVQGSGSRTHVVAANNIAHDAGVQSGMPLAAAQAICADLRARPRDIAEEQRALKRLAAWAYQFTSHVRLASAALLLEVAGSLRLFGGLTPLFSQLRTGLDRLGYAAALSAGPTPLGAQVLAHAGREWCGQDPAQWRHELARLPLTALEISAATHTALNGCGLTRVGELTRLPRAGLAPRFGAEFVDYLDRLYGRIPDLQTPYALPDRFDAELIFPGEVHDSEGVLFGAQRLLFELEGFLHARDSGIQRLQFSLRHHRPPATDVLLKLTTPRRAAAHLLNLLRERLQSAVLRDVVVELRLRARDLQPWRGITGDLFGADREGPEAVGELWERLQARLGDTSVQGIATAALHRPEHAWRYCATASTTALATPSSAPLPERPLWLLPKPRSLGQGLGAWRILHGPERIESGWWDEDIARDYFIAQDGDGARYWVFRERNAAHSAEQNWFLHGIFA